MTIDQPRALALFSGGLDSILACRVIMAQNIPVQAVKFVTPFFGHGLLARSADYASEIKERYGIEVILRDISAPYLAMVGKPAHGYGKHFNPCLDCKILMLTEARRLLPELGATFIITGEVVGQRPMSQRLDTLRLIERESGCRDILLRPLSARSLPETRVEREGFVAREKLPYFKGRDRSPQIKLAATFGINDYPAPAGGCVLTDPNLSGRIRTFYEEQKEICTADVLLLRVGRHFRLPDGGWLIVGRDEKENDRLLEHKEPDDWLLKVMDRPGPTAILRHVGSSRDMEVAAGIVVRYARKINGQPQSGRVQAVKGDDDLVFDAAPLTDELLAGLVR